MRSFGVGMPPPHFDDDLGFAQGVEDFAIQAFVAHFTVERFTVSVFPGTAGSMNNGWVPTVFNHRRRLRPSLVRASDVSPVFRPNRSTI